LLKKKYVVTYITKHSYRDSGHDYELHKATIFSNEIQFGISAFLLRVAKKQIYIK